MQATAENLLAFLGLDVDDATTARATVALELARGYVAGYTRDRGFTDTVADDALGSVIVTTAARLYSNPTGITQEMAGQASVARTTFNGFTLAEMNVLDRYREKVTDHVTL